MAKKRVSIPKHVSDQVLKEYRHKCAICGRSEPQLHHLDEDPSNNDPMNLLPLCPNCHLQDTHDPTGPPDPRKLKLFRRFKDPAILDPRFHTIFRRMIFLREVEREKPTRESYRIRVNELINFIEQFQMGAFYKEKILSLLNFPSRYYQLNLVQQGSSLSESDPGFSEEAYGYALDQVELLIVEILRYQSWTKSLLPSQPQ